MASIRVVVITLVLALTLGLALPATAQPLSGPEYIPLTPCRVFDSRTGSPTGSGALFANTTGGSNTATGVAALFTTGSENTALGLNALVNNTTGGRNTAIGNVAGPNVTTGSDNIHVSNIGTAADTGIIRVGTVGIQTATFIAGIRNVVITGDPSSSVRSASSGSQARRAA